MSLASATLGSLRAALAQSSAFRQLKGILNALSGGAHSVSFTVGAEDTNAINVACQLKDEWGNDLAQRAGVRVYLSDDANGDSIAGTAPDGGIAIGTDGLLEETTANKAGFVTSEADGDFDITITESSVDTWYLVVVLPSGKLSVSGAITFAS